LLGKLPHCPKLEPSKAAVIAENQKAKLAAGLTICV
jgi:hypothetical protein